jgi:Ni/Co efflux regulator RcnB
MSRRLAATLVALALAAPFTAAAQGDQPHGQEREGGNVGERGGGVGDRSGFGGDHSGRRGDWPVQEGEGPRGRYRPPEIDRVPREPVPLVSRLPRNNARMPGRRVWSRGQFLPDFERYHLRRPPRGYYWYRAGEDYVLAATGTGVIFEVIQGDDY